MRKIADHELSHEVVPRRVDVFTVLDMDRTLLDTDAVTERLCRQLEHHGVSPRQIEADLVFIRKQEGKSFSLLEYLEAQYGPELFSIVKQEMQERVGRDDAEELLCDGAPELLRALDDTDIPYAILTFGEPANQDFKLTLLRKLLGRSTADLHATVTDVSHKATWLAEAWAAENGFEIPAIFYGGVPLRAAQVVIVDDKLANLVSPNQNVHGILVDNTKKTHSTAEVARQLNAGKGIVEIAAEWANNPA